MTTKKYTSNEKKQNIPPEREREREKKKEKKQRKKERTKGENDFAIIADMLFTLFFETTYVSSTACTPVI